MAELPDVAPGEIIASGHINDIADRAIQRYADFAELQALAPTPDAGDLAMTFDNQKMFMFDGGVWIFWAWAPDVPGYKSSEASVLISTAADAGLDSMVIGIPVNWSGYTLESIASISYLDSGGGNTGVGNLLSTRVRADAQASGTIFAPGTYLHEATDSNDKDAETFTVLHFLEGETSTGNKAIYLNLWRQAAFNINTTRHAWRVKAIRTA